MATGRGADPRRGGLRRRPERRRTLLAEIADLEPDRITPGRRLGAALALVVVILALAAGAGLLVYALFGVIG